MAYASKLGRARINAQSPEAAGICDRCGFVYSFRDLVWQLQWRGPTLQNIRFLVCEYCYDKPQENIRAIAIPPDPLPIVNARIQDYVAASTDYRSLSSPPQTDPLTGLPIQNTNLRVTQNGQYRTIQPAGWPLGLPPYAVSPDFEKVAYGVPVPVLSVFSNGTPQINVTCSAPHGLTTGNQISASGLTDVRAYGMFSVNVTTATAFNYYVTNPVPAGMLLTNETILVTVLVGVPYNAEAIPLDGRTTQPFQAGPAGSGLFVLDVSTLDGPDVLG